MRSPLARLLVVPVAVLSACCCLSSDGKFDQVLHATCSRILKCGDLGALNTSSLQIGQVIIVNKKLRTAQVENYCQVKDTDYLPPAHVGNINRTGITQAETLISGEVSDQVRANLNAQVSMQSTTIVTNAQNRQLKDPHNVANREQHFQSIATRSDATDLFVLLVSSTTVADSVELSLGSSAQAGAEFEVLDRASGSIKFIVTIDEKLKKTMLQGPAFFDCTALSLESGANGYAKISSDLSFDIPLWQVADWLNR